MELIGAQDVFVSKEKLMRNDGLKMYHVEIELDKIVENAISEGASDIHFEPKEKEMIVRYRIDGLLYRRVCIERAYVDKIINRIKILSGVDIGERRVPQDGRWRWRQNQKGVDMRMSTLPTVWGEKIVLRLLPSNTGELSLAELGMEEHILEEVRCMLAKPYGMLLVTGPTGSGKSSTLYGLLREMDREKRNIICLENPVEREIELANQVQINEKMGLTFFSGLKAVLRQDPDIIMVGEIRDTETAQLAVQAALTGHFVLSSLHTNNATGAIERLVDMKIEPFLLKATLVGVVAQRLVRRRCLHCQGSAGCFYCKGCGYKGRIGIYEILKIPSKNWDLKTADKYLLCTLRESGKLLLEKGITTREELMRVGIWE